MIPANSVSVEVVTEVTRVVSVTEVVSVEMQVVLTVVDSLVADADTGVGRRKEETEMSLASISGQRYDRKGDRSAVAGQLRQA